MSDRLGPTNPVPPPKGGATVIAQGWTGALRDISIVNVGSASISASIPANPYRQYLLIHNPNAVTFGVNVTNSSASVGAPGTINVLANGVLVFEDNFIPSNAMAVAGTSGMGLTIKEA